MAICSASARCSATLANNEMSKRTLQSLVLGVLIGAAVVVGIYTMPLLTQAMTR
jgi:hypothetical protein